MSSKVERVVARCVKLHTISGHTAAVIWLSGRPWCAITDRPGGGMMLAFSDD